MKKPLIVISVIIGLLLIVALVLIAPTTPSAGMIQDKRYTAASSELECKTTGTGKSKKTTCKTDHDPEVCEFYLVDGKRMGWTEVSCGRYNEMAVGQYYAGR